MKTFLSVLNRMCPQSIWWISIVLASVVCVGVFIAKDVVNLEPFLVIPVLLASWYGGNKAGVSTAAFSFFSLLSTKLFLGSLRPDNILSINDSFVVLLALIFVAVVVTNFRAAHRFEVAAADSDFLTGINNTRRFYAELANEILRSRRYGHTFSIAYLDVDNFKNINDTLGHCIGDKLLVEISRCLVKSLRTTDIVARVGGDEFACLLPESEQAQAKGALLNAKKALRDSMKEHGWDVSFSIGVVTFEMLPEDIKEAIKLADELMYEVKSNRKDDIAYRVWNGAA